MALKVNEQSPYVAAMQTEWAMAAALIAGTAAMRAAKTLYLPKWPRESDENYDKRISKATLLPAFGRTIGVMTGKPFSKELTLSEDMPARLKDICTTNVDLQGNSLHTFAMPVFDECLGYGLCGVVVDHPVVAKAAAGQIVTVAEEKALGVQPYNIFIRHNQLLGWKVKKGTDGTIQLLQLRYMECVEEDDGEYGTEKIQQVKVWEIGRWSTHRKVIRDGKEVWVQHEEGVCTLARIPFIPFYGTYMGFMEGKSPLVNLAHLNVKHWQSQSDQDNILHVARVPILAIFGADVDSVITIGASQAVKLPTKANMKFVEHTGAAIDAGQKSLLDLEDQMMQVGAELLVVKPGQRTATESSNEAEGNKSDLLRIVENFENSMNQVIALMAEWLKEAKPGTCQLFKDFTSFGLDAASMQQVQALQQGGIISKQLTFKESQRRGTISPDADFEEEQTRIEEEGPPLGSAGEIDPATGLPYEVDPATGLPVKKPAPAEA